MTHDRYMNVGTIYLWVAFASEMVGAPEGNVRYKHMGSSLSVPSCIPEPYNLTFSVTEIQDDKKCFASSRPHSTKQKIVEMVRDAFCNI